MKKNLLYILLFVGAGMTLSSCSEDKLSEESVIKPEVTSLTPFDKWLQVNYVQPYNIDFMWRYDDKETDMNYYNIPSDYNAAIKLAHIVKYTCIEAYDRVAGINFTRQYFPKMLYATGEFEYNNNNTIILGTAEGGKKIYLAGTNNIDKFLGSLDDLNTYYLKTIHHEFMHILNQTKPYDKAYDQITGTTYLSDDWSGKSGATDFLKRGYISAYSQKEGREDIAEMFSTYVTNPQSWWDQQMTEAGTEGAALIQKKLDIVRTYMKTEWNIDLDELRAEVLRRENNVINGSVSLTDLSIN